MAEVQRRVEEKIFAIEAHQVDLLGYSMGGRAALSLAVDHPEWLRRLVLVGARPGLEGKSKLDRIALDEARAVQLEEEGIEAFMDAWEALPVIRSQERIPSSLREEMQHQRRSHSALGLAASLREMGTGTMDAVWGELGSLSIPVLILTGAEDLKFRAIAERMEERISNGRHVSIEEAGHCAHLEQFGSFREQLEVFLGPVGQD